MTHIERAHEIRLAGPVDQVFPLFTPDGETRWVPGWRPDYLHPSDGATAAGMVFRTDHGGEETLWACVDWQPEAHRVRYARVTPSSRLGFVEVACRAAGKGTTARVSYSLTALTPQGEATLAALDEAAFAAMIEGWREKIDACLAAPTPSRT